MIEVIGEIGTSEYSAAISLAEAFEKMWPGVTNSPIHQDHVRIASGVKISGYRVSDLDIVICGVFKRERRFIPNKPINDLSGKTIEREPVTVQNFLIAIEVKDHAEENVQLIGDKISVKYTKGGSSVWKSATDQNIDQVHSLHSYIKDLGHDAYIHRCLYMRNINNVSMGSLLCSHFNGIDFLTAIAKTSKVSLFSSGYSLSSGTNSELNLIINAPIFKKITPSALDRKKMDMIVNLSPESSKLFDLLGTKTILLRGHGGTGKTIMFLQVAWKSYETNAKRNLVLTYNLALAADIKRSLALLNIPSDSGISGISVETVMSFICKWFKALNLSVKDESSYEDYEDNCKDALEMIKAKALTTDDIDLIIANQPDRFNFDNIFIDEAQDWPQAEADLLKALYRDRAFCLADGIDQLVRGSKTNWLFDIKADNQQIINLNKCLRMKRNLAVFANEVAIKGNYKWSVMPNDLAGGGKIIISSKSYFSNIDMHEQLVKEAKEKGNSEIDFLFCVPSKDISTFNGKKVSKIENELIKKGCEVWNGVDEISRKDFPRSKSQYRVIHYASCRGLEGWTVVLDAADNFWDECYRARLAEETNESNIDLYDDADIIAKRYAWQRIIVALTRPIDTLVITLDNLNSEFSKILSEIARANPDFIENYL